jgi:UDPglucose 6-dehydrogenase
MSVAVIGTGYVGLTTAVSLAILGHKVVGIDVNEEKIALLRQGVSPIYEPGLDAALSRALEAGALQFSSRLADGAEWADVLFVCVGTPEKPDGSPDLSYLFSVVEEIDRLQTQQPEERVVAVKSTVPVGTTDLVADRLKAHRNLHIVANPEFLREGCALQDALEPSRIVIGADSDFALKVMERLYAGVAAPRVLTTRANAELIKYASNAFLATRISFMNELARLSAKLGTDVQTVAYGMGLDSRIGPEFLRAGLGYGGSCFPKDTTALIELAKRHGVSLSILEKVREVNNSQPDWFIRQLRDQLGGLARKRIALLGLSFKPDTDDIREAPSLKILARLIEEGANVSAYDPVAIDSVRKQFPLVAYASSPYEALEKADAAVLVTEWKQCTELDWDRVKRLMAQPVLFDGRNAWPVQRLVDAGFQYSGVGKG